MRMKGRMKRSLAGALALCVTMTGMPVQAAQLTEDAQTSIPAASYTWDFESISGTDAGNGASLSGTAEITDDEGRSSKVLTLAGGDAGSGYLQLPEALFSNVGSDGFTISMWVNPDSQADQSYAKIFDASNAELGKSYSGSNWWTDPDFALAVGGGDYDMSLFIGAAGESTSISTQLKYDSHLQNDTWQYLTVSVSPTAYKVYLNGENVTYAVRDGKSAIEEMCEKMFADDYVKSLKYAAIGRSYYTSDSDFAGKIDNISFYESALSEEQAKEVYQNETTPDNTADEPVYNFNFEDGTGAGILVGNAEITNDYNKGKVLHLPGNGSMTLPEDLFGKLGDEGFTISMWVKADSTTGNYTKLFDASNAALGSTYSGVGGWGNPDFALAAGGDIYDMTMYVGEAGTACSTKSKLKYDTHLARGTWQYMTVTVSPTDYKIYLDGNEISYQDAQGQTQKIKDVLPALFADGYLASLKYASIGKSFYTSDSDFKGDVDDISFYAKAMNSDEVKGLYDSFDEIGTDPEPVTMTVDMADTTGAVKHGATGFLYGIGEDNVPDVNLLTALKPYMCEQKPAEGLQHPNGDILSIADTFIEAGGDSIQIACPDIYANWPYEFESFDEYCEKLKEMVQQVKDAGLSDKAVYVLYNEPEGNWFTELWSGNTAKFNAAWLQAYQAVKSVDENARVAGPNFATYHSSQLEAYMKYCAENDCIPDQVSWHVLGDAQYVTFHSDVAEFRSFEKKYWIDPGYTTEQKELVVNEYADFTQLGVPGQLARWIGLFEDEKATACLAYWHISNNLCDLAASENEPNGAWWLYKWYAEMSGETLNIATSGAKQTEFYGVASLDTNKKSSITLFGGVDGKAQIILKNVASTGVFGNKVKVKISSTSWTGINGAAEAANLVREEICAVDADGNVVVNMDDMVAAAAYNLTVTKADEDAQIGVLKEGAWRKTYEGEDAILAGGAKKAGKNWSYACSGTGQAQGLSSASDSVTFKVDVPSDGYYRYDMVYGAATGNNTQDTAANDPKNAIQTLSVDNTKTADMYLENTLTWYMSGLHTEYVYLTAGSHELKIAATDSEGKASIDCMYLTYVGDADALYQEQNVKTYEAELSDFNILGTQESTSVTTASEIAGYSDAGYIVGVNTSVRDGGGIRFTTYATENGMYDLKVKYASAKAGVINYYVNNTNLTLDNLTDTQDVAATGNEWKEATATVFLKKGINIIDLDSNLAELAIDTLTVEKQLDQSATTIIEAEDCKTIGDVTVKENANASGNKYVAGILADSSASNAIVAEYKAAMDGDYAFVVYQSNKELFGSHVYNAQMVDRFVTLSVNDGDPITVYFRNTYSDDSFRSQAVTLNLKKGVNTIKIYNNDYRVHKNGVGGTNVCTNYTPNLDKFEITQVVAIEAPQVADYTSLKEAIAKAKAIKEADYTVASYKVLKAALDQAVIVLGSELTEEEQSKVDTAAKTLNDALSALVNMKYADLTKLKTAIAAAKKVDTSKYTAKSVAAMKSAITAAEKLAAEKPSSDKQSSVDSATKKINSCISALVRAVPAKGVQYTSGSLVYKVTKSVSKAGTVSVVKIASKTATSVSIPKTVKINSYTFKVTAIDEKAFYKNTKLKKVTMGSNVAKIGVSAFAGCTALTKITIGSNVTEIANSAFMNCTKLTAVTIPSKVKTLGKNVFSGDKKLKTITIKSTKLTKVGANAFKNISKKATIKVPSSKVKTYTKLLTGKGQGKNVKITSYGGSAKH